jgi:hypothetical protein
MMSALENILGADKLRWTKEPTGSFFLKKPHLRIHIHML